MEARARIRNGIAGLSVHLDDLDIALEIGIVDQVAISLPMLSHIHVKGGHQLTTVPAGNLLDGINAVGQILRLGKTVFIAGQEVSLAVLGCVIAAGSSQIHGKGRADLRGLDLRFSVVGVLDNGDIALDDILRHIIGGTVVFHRVERSLCSDVIDGRVQQIALGGADFPDRPIVAADVIVCGELTVTVCGVAVHQRVALIHTVDCSGKRAVALGCACGAVALGHSSVPLFKDVGKALFCRLVPLDRSFLAGGDDILYCRVHFLQRVAGADQHILEGGLAAGIRDGVFIDSQTGE